MIEQDKFTYYPLVKAFEKQRQIIDKQVEKQIKPIEMHEKQH